MLGKVLLFLGAVLFLIESIIPGFGAIGAISLVLTVLGAYIIAAGMGTEFFIILAIMLVIFVLSHILLRFISKKLGIWDRICLHEKAEVPEANNSAFGQIGDEGVACTALKPGGVAIFQGAKINVSTLCDYIEPNVKIRIAKIEGDKIIVERLEI